MTERVTRKAFKNGGSVAVRIPKGWIDEDAEIDIVRREDGIVEIRPLDRDARMQKVLQSIIETGPSLKQSFQYPSERLSQSATTGTNCGMGRCLNALTPGLGHLHIRTARQLERN